MKAIAITLPLILALAVPAAGQDTTPPAPPTPPQEAQPSAPVASEVAVEAVVARSVMDRAPVDSGTAFPADVGQLVLWTKVSGAAGSMVRHVWFHGETEVGNVELSVGSSPYRTWSRKTVPPTGPERGTWRCETLRAQ